jgi:ankyrin repeat protein
MTLRSATDVAVVEELISAGVDVNHVNSHGQSALICTAARSYTFTAVCFASALIAAGADVNKVDINGYNALMCLCCKGTRLDFDFAQLLVSSGANVHQPNNTG